MTREEELLLYCLAVQPDDAKLSRIQQLTSSDWDKIVEQSKRHDVAPLLYYLMKNLDAGADIPYDVMRKLRDEYLSSSARNLYLSSELEKVLGKLRCAGIPVIVLKGAHLGEIIYRNAALRPMIDVDLLIRESDITRAEVILSELGYSTQGDYKRDRKDRFHLVYHSSQNTVLIELHWHLIRPGSPLKIDIEGLWRRARREVIVNVEVSVLSIEDLLLYQCYHTSKHLFCLYGLRSLYDISIILDHYGSQIQWETVIHRSREWKIDKCVFLTLLLSKELLDVHIRDEVLDSLRPGNYNRQTLNLAVEQIFGYRKAYPLLSVHIAQMWNVNRPYNKAAIFLKRVFPSRTEMSRMYNISLNSPLILLLYLVRFKDLILRHNRAVWRILHRDQETQSFVSQQKELLELRNWLSL